MKRKLIKSLAVLAIASSAFGAVASADTGTFVYKISNGKTTFYNDGTNSFYQDIWTNAASLWNSTHYVSMKVGSTDDFRAGNTSNSSVTWDGITNTTYNTSTNLVTSQKSWVNTYFTTLTRYTTDIVKGIATHEFGHAVGLQHNSSDPSVMYPASFSYNSSTGNYTSARPYTWPTTADTAGLNTKYGPAQYLVAETNQELSNYNEVSILEPSWAVEYEDLQGLYQNADVIVSGTITGENNEIQRSFNSPVSLETISDLQVDHVLKGSDISSGASLKIKQMGGLDEGVAVVSEDTTFLKQGDTVILFLNRAEDGTYAPINEDYSIFINHDQLKSDNKAFDVTNVKYTNLKTEEVIDLDQLSGLQ